ncbi:MAG: hypothetical protein OEY22_06010 [Candidatus Bathyarchaeota archaeon]|nr:hypothetical protein [Candidatus Bathyarchaeota archaeon]MDH5788805.1 hypothetical protein [Candidatus Bathyarchaeota archaeon]
MKFDWSKRRYRVLVYLLASVAIYAIFSWSSYRYLLYYIDYIGVLLLFLFYGRPHMYGGWYPSNSILPLALMVFGLFVEIFVVCEVAREACKKLKRKNASRKSESLH